MGGSAMDDDWELALPSNVLSTVVLVGRTGNGKSATGNSILGRKTFVSRASSSGITSTCELQRTTLWDGRIVNVIDTPGLFDFSAGSEFIGKELVKCIDLARDGIHAVLVVLSVRTRFSREEEAALQSLRTFFGEKIVDYMVVVFTGGDELEENEEMLDYYLGRECPEPLKKILEACQNRMVLFDNKTKSESKRFQQVNHLFSIVDQIVTSKNGKPYSDEIFAEVKEGALRLQKKEKVVESLEGYSKQEILDIKEMMHRAYDDQLKRITETVEMKLIETTARLEKQLAEEQAVRMEAEKVAQEAHMKSSDEIQNLRESLERARRETEQLRKQAESGTCGFLDRALRETELLRKQAETGTCVLLERALRETEELRKQAESGTCAILERARRETEQLRKQAENGTCVFLGRALRETEELRKQAESGTCAILERARRETCAIQ